MQVRLTEAVKVQANPQPLFLLCLAFFYCVKIKIIGLMKSEERGRTYH